MWVWLVYHLGYGRWEEGVVSGCTMGVASECNLSYNPCIPLYLGMAGWQPNQLSPILLRCMWVWLVGVACSTTLYY